MNLPLPQNKSVDGHKIASQRIASEPLHNEPPGGTTIIRDLPLTNNYSWPLMALRHPALSTASTNANTLPPTGAVGLAFNVFPKDVKGLPTLKILGTTDPAGELQYKVYGTKFHCQWRVVVHHNAREPLNSKCEDDNSWAKWAEGEKWIKEEITIMRTHDDKSDQRAEGLSDRHFELPLDLFKDKRPNEDGSITYRFPQQFRIDVEIQPLFSAGHPLGMNRPENLTDTTKDANRKGCATISQVQMVATAVVQSKNASHVVECDIRTYLTDKSTFPENMSVEACRTERMRRRSKAFPTTQHLTPFKLAIAIEWPSWCKQPELVGSVGGKGKSVALQQKQENGDGSAVEVPDSGWPQTLVSPTGSRAHMATNHIRALSQKTIIPAAESDMLAVSGTFLSTSQHGSTAPSVKNGGNSPREKLAKAIGQPAETITTTKDSAETPGTSQGGEALLFTITNVLDKSRPDDIEHNGSWAPGQDVPDVVTESVETLTLSPVAVDGSQVCDRPHANGDEIGLPVPTSRILGLQTSVKNGLAKPTQRSAPIPQLGTKANPAALASAHIPGSPRHGKKKSFVPSVEIKTTGLRKGISTLQQGSVDAAKSVEVIDFVDSDDKAAPAPATRPLCPETTVQCGIIKQADNSNPNSLVTTGTLATITSAHISGLPQDKAKDVFKHLLGNTSIDLQKGISMPSPQGNAEAAKAVEVIDLVSSDDEAIVLSTKATGKNGIPRSSQRVKPSQTGNPSVSSKDPSKQISGYSSPSKSLKRSFISSPTKHSCAQNSSSAMPTHQTLKSIDQTSEPLAQMPSAASNLSSNEGMPNPPTWVASANPPDKYGDHSRNVLPSSSNQVTMGPISALRPSSEQRPPSVTCYWIMVDEKGDITTKRLKIAQCHICKVTFSEFRHLKDHLESVHSHPDRSIKILYDKERKKCDIRVRPLAGDPPFVEEMFKEYTKNSKRVSGRPRKPDKPSLVSSTPFVADASSAIGHQSPQAIQKRRTSQASQLGPLSSASPATLHKRCKWSSITWDNGWIEVNDDRSRCILCDKQFSSFEKLRSHLKTDIIHCCSSITIAHDPDSMGCRILADQLKWVNCDDKTQTIFEEVSAPGKRTRIRRSICSDGTINVNDDVRLHKRVEATRMTCFWVMEDDINENNDNECLLCRERFATFVDLRWHLAYSTTDDHDGFWVKIMYSLDGQWCQINVSKRHYPEDTESYCHGFDEVFPDGLDMWQKITEIRPDTYDKLKRHTDTTLFRSANQQVLDYKVNDVSCKWKFWPCHWGEEAPEQTSDSGQCLICLKECGSFRGLRDHLMHGNVWHRWCVTILHGDDPLKVEICLENMPTLGLFFERKSKAIGVSSSHPSVLQRPQDVQGAKRPLASAFFHSPVNPVYWDIDIRLRAKPGTCQIYRTYECIACDMDVFSTFEELQDHLLHDNEHENHTVLFAGPKGGADRCIRLSKRHSTQISSRGEAPQSRTKSPTGIVSAVSEHAKSLPISPLHPLSSSVPQLCVGIQKAATALHCTFIAASKSSGTTGLGNIKPQIASKEPATKAPHISHDAAISVAPNVIERCLNSAKNLYNREKLSVIALKDNDIGQEGWFCNESRKRGYSRSAPSAADNDNGRDKLDYDAHGDEKTRWNWNRPAGWDPNDSTGSSAQDSRRKLREKNPNAQPRKKRRMTNDIEATLAQDVILAYDANSVSSSNQAVVNLADVLEVSPPEGSGMPASNKVQSSNAKRLANDELGPEHNRKRARLDGDISRADTLSTEHSHQAAARNTHIAKQSIVAESSTEWHSPQPSHSKKAKQANGPCFECKAILSTRGWHHRLPHQKRSDDGTVWCRNCYARHYNRLERDGGPCFLCRKTRSKKWHHKLQDEERHGDGRMFCSKCYSQKSAKRKAIIFPETNHDSASSEHEVAPSVQT